MVDPDVPTVLEAILVTLKSALVRTASVSDAEQTPEVIDPHELVLLTVAGGVIDAVLVTKGWAWATAALKTNKNRKAASPRARRTQ